MFESLLDATDTAIGAFIFDAWNNFIVAGRPWVLLMSVLFVVITGYLMLTGRLSLSLSQLFPRIVKWLAVITIVLNFDAMIVLLFNLFTNVPEAVATNLADIGGETEGGINGSVGLVWSRGLESAQNIFAEAGLTTWSPIIFGILVLIVTLLAVVYITFLLMLAKLAVAVLLGLAPFFIVLYIFDATRPVFEGWLRQLISFALIPVFLYGLLALLISMMNTMSDQMLAATAAGVWGITHVGPYALVMVVAVLLATQVMGWAAGVGGGFSLSSLGALGAASRYGAGYATGGATWLASKLRGRGRGDLAADAKTLATGSQQGSRSGSFNQGRQAGQDRWQDRSRRERNRPS